MGEPIIALENISKRYDQHDAVNQLSLTISKGEIFGLLGPNGAGKTTTILMMLGLSEPTSGSVRVCGIDSTHNPIEVKRRVGYLPDDVGFYQHMTGMENLLYTAVLNGISRKDAEQRAYELLGKVNLLEAAHKKAGKYSRGMRQRLGLADVLMKNPDVIILDEPTLGIDPEGVRDFLALIKELNEKEKLTVLLSSHHLHQVQQICDRVGIFVDGKLLALGNVASLAKQLFLEDTFVIHVSASPVSKELVDKLRSIPAVHQVDRVDNELDIYCDQDVTATISKIVVESGSSLFYISRKDFGLDEIYHRYFEGRELNGSR
ncbi:ABC transporter ATP-binding protein [Caldibacillus lycopersici]|uniref:ABC transporter ATP-binding protein n=1 Tax=Perspicuibacillus lycopersici TaxID=1325689 RepID=A0AAE3IQT3_9BACI|nr:ABC transporter ATP-binding protein [Perspicuibacillus lycopersici]MCU9612863.1 ABC transporter ATP-binding protein [Perspicuibacillus lycopersici]